MQEPQPSLGSVKKPQALQVLAGSGDISTYLSDSRMLFAPLSSVFISTHTWSAAWAPPLASTRPPIGNIAPRFNRLRRERVSLLIEVAPPFVIRITPCVLCPQYRSELRLKCVGGPAD